jgi:predicted RNA-binding protein YlqC (UPF0109 family)
VCQHLVGFFLATNLSEGFFFLASFASAIYTIGMTADTSLKGAVNPLVILVKQLAEALVDRPQDVTVTEVVGEQTTVIALKVASDDLGKVIGKQGRTAKAIRTILIGAATKLKKRVVLEIIE